MTVLTGFARKFPTNAIPSTNLLLMTVIRRLSTTANGNALIQVPIQYRGLNFWTTKPKDRQIELLRLPVPTLAETTERFLKFARPLQTDAEFEETVKLVREFFIDAQGRTLQRFIEDRASQMVNWLTPWWVDWAYLKARTPLPIVTSPGVTLPHYGHTGQSGQVDYAAQIIHSLLKFHHQIIDGKLPEDEAAVRIVIHKNVNFKTLMNSPVAPKEEISTTVPLDMGQYQNLFGTTRVPMAGKDTILYGKNRGTYSRHILVVRNGHTFQCPVYNQDGQILGIGELKSQLEKIIAKSETVNKDPINLVSSGERDCWAEVYSRLKENNPTETEAYESALFLLALDQKFDRSPAYHTLEDQNMAMALHGGGAEQNTKNRWFDKTLQFYVNTAGWAGMTYEHTPAEGPPLARLLDFVCDQIEKHQFAEKSGGSFEEPARLDFRLVEEDQKAMEIASKEMEKMVNDLEVKSVIFPHFGKNIPKSAKLSPDAFIQIALQVAFHRMHGNLPPTYETGTLRRFIDGRTDTIRSPTIESAAFVWAFNGNMRLEPGQLMDLLKKAVQAHKDYTNRTMSGKGMDRHLLALRVMAHERGLPAPKLLDSPAYKKMMHFQLSTSQVPTKHTLPMGFGPSEEDCYGLCYNPQERQIFFSITAYNRCSETSAAGFTMELEKALLDMQDLVASADEGGQKKLQQMEKLGRIRSSI